MAAKSGRAPVPYDACLDPHRGCNRGQIAGQRAGRGGEPLGRVGREPFKNKEPIPCGLCDLRPLALSPVPSAAGYARIVAPHDLTLRDVLGHPLAVCARVERLTTVGPDEPGSAV